MIENYHTFYLDLPSKIKGFCTYNPCEDFYTIILNSRLSHSQNIKTFLHELKHISNDDFNNDLSVAALENLAH